MKAFSKFTWGLGLLASTGCGRLAPEAGDADDAGDVVVQTDGPVEGETGVGDESSVALAGSCPALADDGAFVHEAQAASSMAAVYCIALGDCECSVASESVMSCRHGLAMEFESLQERAQEAQLTYDGDCLGAQLAAIEGLGCAVEPEGWNMILGSGHCSLYFGTQSLGEPCEDVGWGKGVSNCERGLACWHGICEDPCAQAHGPRGFPYNFSCAEGLEADRGNGCLEAVAVGSDCWEGPCGPEAYCKHSAIPDCDAEGCWEESCQLKEAEGDECDRNSHCVSNLCVAGRCRAAAQTGDDCVEDRCSGGYRCVEGRCVPRPAICAWTPEDEP